MAEKPLLTAADWDACKDPARMQACLGEAPSGRKLQLFGVACCRHCKDQDRASLDRYDAAEGFVEGTVTAAELRRRWKMPKKSPAYPEEPLRWAQAWCAPGRVCGLWHPIRARLLREVFANPLRPPRLSPDLRTWNGGTIVRLAEAAYDERQLPAGLLDPVRLGVLADALEEAGCTHPDVLGHLRGDREHFRGCWLVDLLAGKE